MIVRGRGAAPIVLPASPAIPVGGLSGTAPTTYRRGPKREAGGTVTTVGAGETEPVSVVQV